MGVGGGCFMQSRISSNSGGMGKHEWTQNNTGSHFYSRPGPEDFCKPINVFEVQNLKRQPEFLLPPLKKYAESHARCLLKVYPSILSPGTPREHLGEQNLNAEWLENNLGR